MNLGTGIFGKSFGKNMNSLLGRSSKPSGISNDNLEMAGGLIAGSTPVPGLEDLHYQEFTPDELQYIGDFNPANLSPTELRRILVDSNITNAQNNTLGEFQNIYNQGGMTAIDRARLQDIQSQQQSVDKGQREAILQSQDMRGMGRGGSTLAALLQSAQGGANIANQNALDVNAQAQSRALQALAQTGQLSTQMNDQQYRQKANAAQAQDVINQFNNQNMNEAARRNLELRQMLSNQNTDNRNDAQFNNINLRNEAQHYNQVEKPMNIFDMQSGNARSIGQGVSNMGQMKNTNRQAQKNRDMQMAGTALQTGGTVAGGAAASGYFR